MVFATIILDSTVNTAFYEFTPNLVIIFLYQKGHSITKKKQKNIQRPDCYYLNKIYFILTTRKANQIPEHTFATSKTFETDF